MKHEELGPADRIIQTVLAYSDHMVHNRPGMVEKDASATVGVKWSPVTHREEAGKKIVYRMEKVGKKTVRKKVGVLQDHGQIKDDAGRIVGDYRPAGLFPEVDSTDRKSNASQWSLANDASADSQRSMRSAKVGSGAEEEIPDDSVGLDFLPSSIHHRMMQHKAQTSMERSR